MLTKKQYELLMFIDRKLKDTGISPSYDEMKEALGLASKSGIHRLITGLEERGFIRRLPHRARALEVIKLPENATEKPASATQRPNVIRPDFNSVFHGSRVDRRAESTEAVHVPLYGKIAAGTPIEALRDQSAFVEVPVDMIGRGEHYALQVEGDSMVEAGILDGDTIVIRRGDTADNGSIVVALVEEEEVTLKRIRKKGASIALEPANKAYEPRIFGPDQIKVQGQLVGLLRQY